MLSPFFFFFFNDTATPEIYTLSLHDALPIRPWLLQHALAEPNARSSHRIATPQGAGDRKSTRLNSSHSSKSYDVFCLKKKKKKQKRKRYKGKKKTKKGRKKKKTEK